MGKIRVYLVEDQTLVRESLRAVLEHDPGIGVAGEAGEAATALRELATLPVDVVLMDVMLPDMDGIEGARHLRASHKDLPIVMLTGYAGQYVGEAIEAGAVGYILKTATSQQLVQAVRAAFEGLAPIDPSLTSKLIQELKTLRQTHRLSVLKARQLEILKLGAQGLSYRDIAETLFISLTTVKREMNEIFTQLGAKNLAQAVSEALKKRLI
jgi:DNA-binding NarL/FixJ family response regulator